MHHHALFGLRFSPKRIVNFVLFSLLVYCVFIETEISIFNKGEKKEKFVDTFLHPIDTLEQDTSPTKSSENNQQPQSQHIDYPSDVLPEPEKNTYKKRDKSTNKQN